MPDDVVIRVENLSKQYRIGGAKEGYKTFRETLVDAAKAPFQQLGSLFNISTNIFGLHTMEGYKCHLPYRLKYLVK